jgi:hypothetical protein
LLKALIPLPDPLHGLASQIYYHSPFLLSSQDAIYFGVQLFQGTHGSLPIQVVQFPFSGNPFPCLAPEGHRTTLGINADKRDTSQYEGIDVHLQIRRCHIAAAGNRSVQFGGSDGC